MVFPTQRPNNNMFQNPNSRLLPNMNPNRPATGNNIQQMIQRFSNPQSSVTSLANKGFGNISKTLTNVQQVIKVVQSATPVVQEYAPMVKNLPAMYRMVKALKDVESDDTDKSEINDRDEQDSKEDVTSNKEERRRESSGYSTPKLYI